MSYDVIVIGAGLFGSTVAAAFRKEKRKVLVLDDDRPHSGSKPAACLLKPSWFHSLGNAVYEPALAMLDDLYHVRDLRFWVGVKYTTVHWCDPKKILIGADKKAKVAAIKKAERGWVVLADQEYAARLVVVAAGTWTGELLALSGTHYGQAGLACLWPDKKIARPFVRVWAPYRQITAFDRGDGVWVGDSSAIRASNWTPKHAQEVEQRCAAAVKFQTNPKRLFGIRPYADMKPCYLKEEQPGLWAATGGAKNGTLAAGWCASELLRRA